MHRQFGALDLGRKHSATGGGGRFNTYSAGSQPKGCVKPLALEVLSAEGYPTDGLCSKSWTEFAGSRALVMDFVFTVCKTTAGETCPVWPSQPMTAHWGIEDPAAVEGTAWERKRAFVTAFRQLHNRIPAFVNLPLKSLDGISLRRRLAEIGQRDHVAT